MSKCSLKMSWYPTGYYMHAKKGEIWLSLVGVAKLLGRVERTVRRMIITTSPTRLSPRRSLIRL